MISRRKFGALSGNTHVFSAKVAARCIWREAPYGAIANYRLPVCPVVIVGFENGNTAFRQPGEKLAFRLCYAG